MSQFLKLVPPAPAPEEGPLDHFVEDGERIYAGRHLTIDLYGASDLTDQSRMEQAFRDCVTACGATLLHLHVHTFLPSGGLSGVAVLAESHISVHTWPEAAYAAFDVFMCGDAEPERAVDILAQAFSATAVEVGTHYRGADIKQHLPK
ncbi:S-adenosylmethionine decarboxylase [Parvularcula bermudensis HTCC2503]|uniref:S-adenosylmethionine decarboxylase proenzyme n=1 Tax=Parvularcula bermudensis (strain ATCC BAA-594 / HTCC2503 / KCTC 12087) TaxID=314260 RepID=E0TIA7_PARBH|nr:adenosylmethionine decarboxylase [Parvularcula bermudensis]ADM09691.1 S-adenosylmethionine decarboxylase [Parvularcula bermudensis HTCC2503]